MWNFPNKGSNLCLLQWRRGVLTIGSPGKSDECSSGHAEMQILRNKQEVSSRQLDMVGMELGKEAWEPLRSEDTRLNSSHSGQSRMPSSA